MFIGMKMFAASLPKRWASWDEGKRSAGAVRNTNMMIVNMWQFCATILLGSMKNVCFTAVGAKQCMLHSSYAMYFGGVDLTFLSSHCSEKHTFFIEIPVERCKIATECLWTCGNSHVFKRQKQRLNIKNGQNAGPETRAVRMYMYIYICNFIYTNKRW